MISKVSFRIISKLKSGGKEFQINCKRDRLEIKIGGIKRREMQGCEKCKQISRTRITSKRPKEDEDETTSQKTELKNHLVLKI